jgi:putative oxaloacetate decarboxylase alpha chain|nr:MAG TPA: hypothetical protein [Caudoviricetes sp.]
MTEYTVKSRSETLGATLDDILKYEATPLTRVAVAAPKGTKRGALVEYTGVVDAATCQFVALTDEADGKVLIQPVNCVVDVRYVSATAVQAAHTDLNGWRKACLPFGIVLQGELS